MPHFTLQLSKEGPMVLAYACVSTAREGALEAEGIPVPQWAKMQALIDTGASITCIDESILRDSLNLAPTGQTKVNTPSSGRAPVDVDMFDISLLIPGGAQNDVPLLIKTMPVVCANLLIPQGFHALIGRDVLGRCVLTYNGTNGSFILAY